MTLDWTTLKALRQARFTVLTCAFAAPAIYAGAIATQTLGGRWQRFFQNLERIPWQQPRVAGATALALAALAAAMLLPPRMRIGSSALAALRARTLVAAMLLLVVAVCGLYLGMKAGSAAAPLALALLACPPLAGLRLLPTIARWERTLGG